MFDTICTLPLSSELFAQALHPTEPLVTVGLSSGHVATLRLPPVDVDADDNGHDDDQTKQPARRGSNGTQVIDTTWRTKRHKGSCRYLAYSVDGRQLYSAGTDGLVKAADSETGKVTGKLAIPNDPSAARATIDAPTVVHALSPQTLLLATDSGALHLYDLRDPAPSLPVHESKTAFITGTPSQTYHPHADYISSLSPIPPSATSTSGFSKQWLTTGSTTLALTDLRRGVLAKSEDQEELLLSCLYVTGLAAKKSSGSTGEKAVVGGGDGVITLWEKGQWDDQDERITVSREKETLDCMAQIPDGIGGLGKKIAVGMGDGRVRVVRLGMNRVVGEFQHDEVEGVVALDFDVGGRMISGGGQTIKVWQESIEPEADEDEDDGVAMVKRAKSHDSDEEEEEEEEEEEDEGNSSDDGEKGRKRRKKRKRGKGPAASSSFSFAGLD
ncbi:WD repeat-containing jip5 [Lecanosticta acicola]|uniref:WD repeat-containing protein JIP5 n=1 Tax=Lecanosticta acicola TaxID=111012 RepID=A0AAI8Z6T9_9PEZI|nr:WD repeat-containing jip5 [Lecanosticta acicola]